MYDRNVLPVAPDCQVMNLLLMGSAWTCKQYTLMAQTANTSTLQFNLNIAHSRSQATLSRRGAPRCPPKTNPKGGKEPIGGVPAGHTRMRAVKGQNPTSAGTTAFPQGQPLRGYTAIRSAVLSLLAVRQRCNFYLATRSAMGLCSLSWESPFRSNQLVGRNAQKS